MTQIFNLRGWTSPSTMPTLVLMDMQQLQLTTSRALDNCRAALRRARAAGLPVAFSRLLPVMYADEAMGPATRWIDGFVPTRADMIFDRDKPSCYASAEFADVVNLGSRRFALAGFSGESSCLATAIDAFHRGHKFTFLFDASASRPFGRLDAEDAHLAAVELIAQYGAVQTTADWIAECARAAPLTLER